MFKILNLCALALTLTATSLSAINPIYLGKTQVNLETMKDAKILKVDLSDVGKTPITITIKNQNGDVLQVTNVKENQDRSYRFNLEELNEGDYQVIFSTDTKELVQHINICANCSSIEFSNMEEKFKPSFKFQNNLLDINVLNNSLDKVKVTLYNEEGVKVMEDITSPGLNFGRRFDLSQLSNGRYTASMQLNDRTYYYTVNKN
ncbi:MAG: DUF3244 domain-containing protein [Saprospiraceae bacterium]